MQIKLSNKTYDALKKYGTVLSSIFAIASAITSTLVPTIFPSWVAGVFAVIAILNKFLYTASAKSYYKDTTVEELVKDVVDSIEISKDSLKAYKPEEKIHG